MSGDRMKGDIAYQIYVSMKDLNAPPGLLSIVGSYGDTLSDEEILSLLRAYNETGKVLHERQ
jgi:hypothetical protein